MSDVVVFQGRDLPKSDLLIINEYRKTEFNSVRQIDPSSDVDAARSVFFLLRDKGQLVAFGRLHRLTVRFELSEFHILGIATIIATSRGKGYGTELMKSIAQYVRDRKMTAIGFCDSDVTGFYRKCGFSILREGIKRFSFIDPKGAPATVQHPNDDVLYLDGPDHLVQLITENPTELIRASRRPW